jgi:3-mercaptopyruvate sulfurtransferase SseA
MREFRMARITPEELKEKLDAGQKVLIVDLHSHRGDARNHRHQSIPGAVCIDSRQLERRGLEPRGLEQRDSANQRAPIPRDCEVVLYCTAPRELTSARVALQLRRRGFERVRPLAGGLEAWRERGFPLTLVVLCGVDEPRASIALSPSVAPTSLPLLRDAVKKASV